jgi:hypothetical protein
MKKIILMIAMFLLAAILLKAQSQTEASIRIGMKTKPASPMIAAGVDFKINSIVISPEMIADVSNSEPVNFGLKAGYEYEVSESIKLRAGAGIFYQLYSMDAYDKNRNGFTGNYFFSAQYKKWFGQAEYMGCVRLSIGMRTPIFNN